MLPIITSSLATSGTINVPFTYIITASNDPTGFDAKNLPKGLSVHHSTGAILGTPTRIQAVKSIISAANHEGTNQEVLTFTIMAAMPHRRQLAEDPLLAKLLAKWKDFPFDEFAKAYAFPELDLLRYFQRHPDVLQIEQFRLINQVLLNRQDQILQATYEPFVRKRISNFMRELQLLPFYQPRETL